MYQWRNFTDAQRDEILRHRKLSKKPWHTPPHPLGGAGEYHLTAACYQHEPIIGFGPDRMDWFSGELLNVLSDTELHAWCVLPNHYHLHVSTVDLKLTISSLGRLHGRASFQWNAEESKRGRQVWHSIADRGIRNESHGWATINYVHHNPVRHGYVEKWQDWPWSSAHAFLERVGEAEARKIWKRYPVLDYGEIWDEARLESGL